LAVITLYSAVGKFSADARSRCAGVEIYSKYLEKKQMQKNRQPVFGSFSKVWKTGLFEPHIEIIKTLCEYRNRYGKKSLLTGT